MQLFAQNYLITGININLPPSPDGNTANWGTGTSMLTITASTKAINGRIDASLEESKILVTIKKGGNKVCGSFTGNTAPSSNFNTLTKVWAGNNAVSLLGSSCVLPSGDYEICVQFFGYNYGGYVPISDEKTKPFTIKGEDQQVYQAPQTNVPSNGNIFSENDILKPITFRWTPVIPSPKVTVTYRLKVWELMQGQNGTQAIKSTQPIFTKDITNSTQTVITNLLSDTGTPSFIWNVQALNQEGKPIGENNGLSEPSTFNIGKKTTTPHVLKSSTSGCSTISTKNFKAGDLIGLSDQFIMKLTANPTGSNDSLTGTGTVCVKWLGTLNVKFKGIKINGQNQLCTGTVYTNTDPSQVYPTQWAINAMNNTSLGSWTISKIKSVCADIKANKTLKPLVKATNQIDTTLTVIPLNMPLGYFKANDTTTSIGFTEMMFKPDHAEFEVIASLPTKGVFKHANNNGTDVIALRGSGIHFTGSGLSGITGSVKLLDPVVFSFATGTEYLKLTFNKEGNGHIGNGIEFSAVNNEFWKYDFDANVELPKEWLIPVDSTKTNVDMNFQMAIAQWDDFILEGNLPACIIPHSNGIGLEADTITYDHSSISNVAAMQFPDGYQGDTTSMFSGFYLKKFKLTLPDQLRSYADTSKKINIVAENLIIDQYGVSGKILANNVLNYPKGNIGNLGASIDTVKFSLTSSVLTEAMMLGKITLPLSTSDDNSNAINYSAIFSSGNPDPGNPESSSITFALQPDKDITSKFLGDGKVQIDQTSSLNLILSKSSSNKREIKLDIDLNGKLYYPTGKIIDPDSSIPLDLDLSCNFEHLGMSYDKTAQETFTFNPGHWSFASPQKKLSGFAFTIVDVKPKIEPIGTGTEKQYLFKGGVEFVAKINIGSENSKIGISGDTKIVLTGAIESSRYTPSSTPWPATTTGAKLSNATILNNMKVVAENQSQVMSNSSSTNPNVIISGAKADYGFLTQLKPKYLGVQVESIHIDAHMPALTIKGSVDFYKHDAVYGNGFKGDLQAKFTTMDLAIQAGAIFGNTKYIPGNTTGFKYWMVQAQVNLPPPGIVFMTGIAFRGFGAGVYSRMNMTPPATFDPTSANSSTFGGATFTPDYSILMGFKVKAIIATTPKEETFNGSVALGAEFNSNGGMNFIQIDGLFNCGSKIGEENTAFANGGITVKYDFPKKIFDMKSKLTINTDVIKTVNPINVHFYIDGLKNEWAFKCGVPPDSLNTVVLFNNINVSEYLMFGNKIPVPGGFMPTTLTGLHNAGLYPTFNQSAISSETKSAKGFAFGIGVNFGSTGQKDGFSVHCIGKKDYLTAGAKWSINVGGEFDASLLQYDKTICPGLGHTGWRMKTQIAVYANADIKAYYHRCWIKPIDGEIDLLSISGGAYVDAEFPNPFYAEGGIGGTVNIFDGAVSFGYTATFKTGERCGGSPIASSTNNVYTQQNAVDSLSYLLIKNIIVPGSTTEVSRTTDIAVLLNYPDNEPFDVQEQQSSGQMNVRTFRAFYTPTLMQDSAYNNATLLENKPISTTVATINPVNTTSTVNQQHNTHISSNSAMLNNITVNKKATLYQPAITQTTMTAASTTVGLTAIGYDALGARLYRISKSGFLTNPLKPNTSYKFLLSARLEEKINNSWQVVKNPTTNKAIVQTQQMYFKTNAEAVETGAEVYHPSNTAVHL
jgi:hypothetical protein